METIIERFLFYCFKGEWSCHTSRLNPTRKEIYIKIFNLFSSWCLLILEIVMGCKAFSWLPHRSASSSSVRVRSCAVLITPGPSRYQRLPLWSKCLHDCVDNCITAYYLLNPRALVAAYCGVLLWKVYIACWLHTFLTAFCPPQSSLILLFSF